MKFNEVLVAEKTLHGLTWTCQSHQIVCNLKKFSSSVYCSRVCASLRLSLEDEEQRTMHWDLEAKLIINIQQIMTKCLCGNCLWEWGLKLFSIPSGIAWPKI